MGKINSRTKGHAYERKIRLELQELGYIHCQTSRNENRILDSLGVDLTNTNPFNIQCKAVEKLGSYHKILEDMPKDSNYNVVMHKKNNQGETVTMSKADFYEIIERFFN